MRAKPSDLRRGTGCIVLTLRTHLSRITPEFSGREFDVVERSEQIRFIPLRFNPWFVATDGEDITWPEALTNHCPRDVRGLGVHPLVH